MKPVTTGNESFSFCLTLPDTEWPGWFLALATTPEQPLRSALADGQS